MLLSSASKIVSNYASKFNLLVRLLRRLYSFNHCVFRYWQGKQIPELGICLVISYVFEGDGTTSDTVVQLINALYIR
jgi:hypothetical protein